MSAPDASVLAGALLWLRNHYDVGELKPSRERSVLHKRVVERIDRVLNDFDVGVVDTKRFRERYPADEP